MSAPASSLTLSPSRSRLAQAGALVLRHPLALLLAVLPLALVLGSVAGYAVGKAGAYRAERLRSVSADLRAITGDYLLAAGDSHIERWPARRLCGLPLVNAGLSGATAAGYGQFLAELPISRPPRAIIMTIGTNDASEKRVRSREEAERRFVDGFSPLLARLRRTTPLVVLTGVPRIDPRLVDGFSPAAAERIGQAAHAACTASSGCLYVAAPGAGIAQIDGVHFTDYAAAYRGVAPKLCTALLGETAVATGLGAGD